jgi:hypothetical protein
LHRVSQRHRRVNTAELAVEPWEMAEKLTCFETNHHQTARIVRSFPESDLDREPILVKGTGKDVSRSVR